jgi:hypothetical protein
LRCLELPRDALNLSPRPVPKALTSGISRALVACSIFLLAAALIALRATNTRGEATEPTLALAHDADGLVPVPESGD